MAHNPVLHQILCNRIRQSPHQRITFADFMAEVLYHPEAGYYTTQTAAIGPQGDFVTSSHLSHDFGELLAEQFLEIWLNLGSPDRFSLVEVGAGQGVMAADVLAYLQAHHGACFGALRYLIVETSPVLRAIQRKRLAPWADRLTWLTLEDLPEDSVIGCFFSNELVDALPVHQVMLTEAGLQEVYVSLAEDEASLQERVAPLSTPRLRDYFDLVGVDWASPPYPLGYRTEAHLAALEWIQTVAQKLHCGYVLTIDYGYSAERYYSRSRSQGTLQCYFQHAHHHSPYSHLGHQDITAHVNFTALERYGEQWGLTTLGSTPQAMFLMALGLGDRLAALADIQATDPETLQMAIHRRDQLHQLINPLGLGNFGVLLQGKNLPPGSTAKALKGFTIPSLSA